MASSKRAGRLIIPAILAAAGLWNGWRTGSNTPAKDFYQFWAGAKVARSAGGDSYSAEARKTAAETFRRRSETEHSDKMFVAARARENFEFFSTPFLYACFGLFGEGGGYDRDLSIYRVVCLASTTAGVILIGRSIGMSLAAALVVLAGVTTLFVPLRSDIAVGNVNQLQLLMLAGVIALLPGRALLAGLVLGLALAFKPNVLFVVPLLAFRMVEDETHRLKPRLHTSVVGGVVIGVFAAVAIASLYFGSPAAWLEWLRAARELVQATYVRSQGNLAMAPGYGWIPGAAALAIIGGAMLWKPRRWNHEPALLAGLGVAVYLLSAPLVWPHYLVLAIPLAMAVAGDDGSMIRCGIALAALTVIAVDPWVSLGIGTTFGQSAVIWTGMMLVFAMGVWRLRAALHHDAPRVDLEVRSS